MRVTVLGSGTGIPNPKRASPGLAVELGLGRIAPRKGAWASAWLAGGLVAFGVIGLIPANWPVVVFGLVGGAGLVGSTGVCDPGRRYAARLDPRLLGGAGAKASQDPAPRSGGESVRAERG